MRTRCLTLAKLIPSAMLCIFTGANAQTYSYTKVAEASPTSPYAAMLLLGVAPNGNVLLSTQSKSGRSEVQIARGGNLTKVADDTGEIQGGVPRGSVNSSGDVVISTVLDDRTSGVFRVKDGKLSLLGKGDGDWTFVIPRITDTGAAAFTTQPIPAGFFGGSKVVISAAGSTNPTVIADQTGNLSGNAASNCDMNSSGQVAFFAGSLFGPGALFLWDPTAGFRSILADTPTSRMFFGQTDGPAINNAGEIAFLARNSDVMNSIRLYRPGTSAPQVIVTESSVPGPSPFKTVQYPMLNSQGVVAFWAAGHPGTASFGFYVVASGIRSKVVGVGDPLFGSVVKGVTVPFGRYLDDSGRVAFGYELQNGEQGIAIAAPPPVAPAIAANGVLNAASYVLVGQPGHAVAPGALVSIFGTNLASGQATATGASLPTTLGDTSVTFDGSPAPLFFAGASNVVAIVPYTVQGQSTVVRVRTPGGESPAITVQVAPTSPAIYTASQQGAGQGIVVVANSGTVVAPPGSIPGARPARGGEILTIYANGLGAVNPSIRAGRNSCDPDGVCSPDYSNLVLRHAVTVPVIEIGGVVVPASDVLFAGLAPTEIAAYQINFRLPANTPKGNAIPIVIRQGSVSSRGDVTIAIQ